MIGTSSLAIATYLGISIEPPKTGDAAVDVLRAMADQADETVRTLEAQRDRLQRQLAQAETDIATNKAAAERMRSAADSLLG